MIIDYDEYEGAMDLACDNCENDATIEEAVSFGHAIELARRKGWVIKRVKNDYKHYCCKACEAASEFD